MFGNERKRWRGDERRRDPELYGRVTGLFAMEREHLGRLVERPADDAAEHQRADRVEPVLERGDDAEVAAPTAQRPKQLGVGVLAAGEVAAVGRHDFRCDEVVAAESEAAREPAEAAAEGETGDPGCRHDAAG